MQGKYMIEKSCRIGINAITFVEAIAFFKKSKVMSVSVTAKQGINDE